MFDSRQPMNGPSNYIQGRAMADANQAPLYPGYPGMNQSPPFGRVDPSARYESSYQWLLGGFFIAFLVYLIYLGTRPDVGENGLLRGISDAFVFFGAAVCAGVCWYTAFRLRGMRRTAAGIMANRAWIAWLLLGGAAATYAIGQGIWTWYDANFTSSMLPFPAIYDPFYLAVYPFAWVGVALLIPRGGSAAGRTRVLLDAGIAVASALAISWYFILGPTLSALPGRLIEKAVALAYPLGDLSLCVAAALLLFGPAGAAALNRSLGRLAIGVTWLAVTDLLYAYGQVQFTYHTGLLQDIGWPMSWLFIGWAALAYPSGLAALTGQRLPEEQSIRRSRLSTTGAALRAVSPILLALLTCVVLLIPVALGNNTAPLIQVVLVCAGLILLPVVRQMLTLVDNLLLNERLRVALGQSQEAYQQSQEELLQTAGRAELYDQLRIGIQNIQAVHAQVARGDLNVRAQVGGPLAPVAQSLNLLIERLNRWAQFAETNRVMENEGTQLRQTLESLGEGRLAWLPSNKPSPLPTGGALVAASQLQRQLALRFGRIRDTLNAIGDRWQSSIQGIQQARHLIDNGNPSREQLMTANDALMQAERALVSRSTSFAELWQQANIYSEGLDPASYAAMPGEYSARRE
jgi:hypothetical protein